jgi:hypothetical protein
VSFTKRQLHCSRTHFFHTTAHNSGGEKDEEQDTMELESYMTVSSSNASFISHHVNKNSVKN